VAKAFKVFNYGLWRGSEAREEGVTAKRVLDVTSVGMIELTINSIEKIVTGGRTRKGPSRERIKRER